MRPLDQGLGLTRTLAGAFPDQRDARYCDHPLPELLAQRLHAMALGYDDLNDPNLLRHDPLLAVAGNKREPLGEDRLHAHPPGVALAGAATLHRLERGHQPTDRYPKIHYDPQAIPATRRTLGVRGLPKHAKELVLDRDAMGHWGHGRQEGRPCRADADGYGLLPRYAFGGDVPLWAALRPGDAEAAEGVVAALEPSGRALRKRGRRARIIVRADRGFAREEILAWCEGQTPEVYYCWGLARNARLEAMMPEAWAAARARRGLTGAARARAFKELA